MLYETQQNPADMKTHDSVAYDNRHHKCQPVSVPGGLSLNGNYFYVEMVALSKDGAKLVLENANNSPETGQPATLYLVWPYQIDSGLLSVETTIVRVEEREVSVHFNHVPL